MPEPSVDEAIQILEGLLPRYEIHHQVSYADKAVVAAARLSHQYIRSLLYICIHNLIENWVLSSLRVKVVYKTGELPSFPSPHFSVRKNVKGAFSPTSE